MSLDSGTSSPDLSSPSRADPSHPISVKVQKWMVFSVFLAGVGVGSDVIATLMNGEQFSGVQVLGKGELYMVSIGMLLSASGELLYDRTRMEAAAAWHISTTFLTIIFCVLVAIMYGYAKSGRSSAEFVMASSLFLVGISLFWGLCVVVLSCRSRGSNV